jgi:uncharacterized RDD family membrane protein YckC
LPAALPENGSLEPIILASVGRRALSLIYEVLLLAALLWCASLLFRVVQTPLGATHIRAVFQAYLLGVAGVYFVWQWRHGGQTLPMRAWGVRLVTRDGSALGGGQACMRYLLATISTGLFGFGFLWALIDRDRQFLHDRLAGTRLVRCHPLSSFLPPHEKDGE